MGASRASSSHSLRPTSSLSAPSRSSIHRSQSTCLGRTNIGPRTRFSGGGAGARDRGPGGLGADTADAERELLRARATAECAHRFCRVPNPAARRCLVDVHGLGRAILGVGTRTLLQRVAGGDMLARVFGVVEAIWMRARSRWARLGVAVLVAIGACRDGCALQFAVLVGGGSLFEVDDCGQMSRSSRGGDRSMRLFSPLSAEKLEALARALKAEKSVRETCSSAKERSVRVST